MKTRYTEKTGIEIIKQGPGIWRHFDTSDNGAVVGPCYKTKLEILADHERYLRENWGLK